MVRRFFSVLWKMAQLEDIITGNRAVYKLLTYGKVPGGDDLVLTPAARASTKTFNSGLRRRVNLSSII